MQGLKFNEFSETARQLWAKSSAERGHPLVLHLLDVAATAEVLLGQEPDSTLAWASRTFGLEQTNTSRWLAALVGLHDFGKATPGFQAKWPEGMQAVEAAGLAFPALSLRQDNHALATAALLDSDLLDLTNAAKHWLRHVVRAVSAHHGHHYLPTEVRDGKPSAEPAEWKAARQTILQAYWQVLSPTGSPSLQRLTLPAVNWLAGLTSTADWIASNPDWFPLGTRGHDDLADYYRHSRTLAADALGRIGWIGYRPLLTDAADADVLVSRITAREGLKARPLQQAGDALLRDAKGPSLLLVEAPMGEGKTELAFLAHLWLQKSNDHRGLFLALPTQATGNAMFKRALTFLDAFAEGPLDVQLVHGGSSMNDDARALRTVHLQGIDNNPGEALSASDWFGQRRRPLLSPYGVGTVDQALYATLNVKHHFVRLWGLGNRVVVLDEVHAYDTYTSGLIGALLQWLKALGSSVVLMSATLPKARRDELIAAWGMDPATIPEEIYPRVLLADERGVHTKSFAARSLPSIHLAGLSADLAVMADKALGLAKQGGCGALIVNTVDRAQQLFALLRGRLDDSVPVMLFHARYPMDERGEREKQVLSAFGPRGERPACALLVATQVAEQSLDLDFDFMLSDLAPVDLLLQRSGRLHRHERERLPAHVAARLWVAGLERDLPDLKKTGWEFVYDPYILGRTWALLGKESVLQLPVDIDRLVQAVYGEEALPADLEQQVSDFIDIESRGKHIARETNERRSSYHTAIDPTAQPEDAYTSKPHGNDEDDLLGLRNVTRLGDETITLIPVTVVDGGWRVGNITFSPDAKLDDATAKRLYARQLRLSRKVVVKHFQPKPLPKAFAEHPLLCRFQPLPLMEGRYHQDGIRLRLDDKLGLVYEPATGKGEETS